MGLSTLVTPESANIFWSMRIIDFHIAHGNTGAQGRLLSAAIVMFVFRHWLLLPSLLNMVPLKWPMRRHRMILSTAELPVTGIVSHSALWGLSPNPLSIGVLSRKGMVTRTCPPLRRLLKSNSDRIRLLRRLR